MRAHVIAASGLLLSLLVACARIASAEPTPLLLEEERDAVAGVDEPVEGTPPDALFPGALRVGVSLASGVPFAFVGELSLGTHDAFALGLIGGVSTTFDEYAVGGRLRVRVFDAGVVDGALVVPVLYYPPVDKRHDAKWVLTSPALLLRGRPSDDWLVYGGAGAVLAACADELVAVFDADAGHHGEEGGRPMAEGAWHTFNAGASVRLYDDLALFLDSMVMMTHFVPSQSYAERIGPPFLAELGANYTF